MIAAKAAAAAGSLWVMFQHGVLGAAALLGALMVIAAFVGKVVPRARRLAGQIGEVHRVILGDDDTQSLPDRLDHGDRRMGAIERDLGTVVGQQLELNRKVGKMEGTIDVLGAQERQEIRAILSVAVEREKQRPEGQEERRKSGL